MPIADRVRTTIHDHHLISKGETVVVAVSGGPDSLTLLHLLLELGPERELNVHGAHLNHQLRGEASASDASFVAATARDLGVPATIEALPVAEFAREHHLSPEEAARIVRYRFLTQVAASSGAQVVAVGHNADDQVESIVMHMVRGAGLAGLRGMTYKSPIPDGDAFVGEAGAPVWLVRPLLEVGRADIEAYCRENGLNPRLDESNLDTTFFRNRIRREVIPFLEELNPNLREVLRRSARVLADDYDYLHAATQIAFAQVAIPEHGVIPASNLERFVLNLERWRGLPLSLQRATLREAVRRLRRGLRDIGWAHIEDARRVASEKGVGAEATLPQGLVLVVGYDDLIIGETMSLPDVPLLHTEMLELRVGATMDLPESEWRVRVEERRDFDAAEGRGENRGADRHRWAAELDADKIRGWLVLRRRRPGERFEPRGLGGRHKSLHEFMIEEKIPRDIRDLLPILADEEKVLWVSGHRVDERANVTDQTNRGIGVEFFKSASGG
jgi:tRNA(Ile)-lysidine synthase